jgi:hypothetical protein
MALPVPARIFVGLMVALGIGVFAVAFRGRDAIQVALFVSFLLMACLSARMKVKLPGITGNMSVNLPFILVAVAQMGLLEALLVGCISNLIQCLPRTKKKFNAVQIAFNFCTMALAVYGTRLIFQSSELAAYVSSAPLRLAIATAGFFMVNTVAVAIVIFLTEKKRVAATWLEMLRLSYPYFLASAGVAGGVLTLVVRMGWQEPAVILVLMLGVFYSYQRFFSPLLTQAQLPLGRVGPQAEQLKEKQMHA